jgi:hypothetical protein
MRHQGNHKYAWSIERRKPIVLASLPYPKRVRAA